MQDSASFWTDIKNLEEQLAKAPDSYCFAGLSSVYLKAGLIDDALHVARLGVAKHPEYLAGQRALSLACHAKGLNDEALTALKRIVVAIPEDVSSQKMLGRLLIESGEPEAAVQVFKIAQEFAPEDVECRLQLESLDRAENTARSAPMACDGDDYTEGDEEIIEDLEILEEFEEGTSGTDPLFTESDHDPLSTVTLAELYVKQGFIHKALEIYRTILVENPVNQVIEDRITELVALDFEQTECDDKHDDVCENEGEGEDVPVFSTISGELFSAAAASPEMPLQGIADNALATLDGWLENIRRIKSCR